MDRKERLEVKQFSSPWNAWREYIGLKRNLIAFWSFLIVHISYITPTFLKNPLIRLTGMKIGKGAAVTPTRGLDFFFPEKVRIGKKSVIGFDATILAHEITASEIRIGRTEIGEQVLIGANATVLPGVKIGDNAEVAAGAVVTRDVEEGQKVGGVPAQPLEDKAGDQGK